MRFTDYGYFDDQTGSLREYYYYLMVECLIPLSRIGKPNNFIITHRLNSYLHFTSNSQNSPQWTGLHQIKCDLKLSWSFYPTSCCSSSWMKYLVLYFLIKSSEDFQLVVSSLFHKHYGRIRMFHNTHHTLFDNLSHNIGVI